MAEDFLDFDVEAQSGAKLSHEAVHRKQTELLPIVRLLLKGCITQFIELNLSAIECNPSTDLSSAENEATPIKNIISMLAKYCCVLRDSVHLQFLETQMRNITKQVSDDSEFKWAHFEQIMREKNLSLEIAIDLYESIYCVCNRILWAWHAAHAGNIEEMNRSLVNDFHGIEQIGRSMI